MAWIRINQPLRVGQFIRLRKKIEQSSFSQEFSSQNALYSLRAPLETMILLKFETKTCNIT
jgi:hypothetical protein